MRPGGGRTVYHITLLSTNTLQLSFRMIYRGILLVLYYCFLLVAQVFSQNEHRKLHKLQIESCASRDYYLAKYMPPLFNSPYENKIFPGNTYGINAEFEIMKPLSVRLGFNRIDRTYGVIYHYIVIDPNDPLIPSKRMLTVPYHGFFVGINLKLITVKKTQLLVSAGLSKSYIISDPQDQYIRELINLPSTYEEVTLFGDGKIKRTNKLTFTANKSAYAIPFSLILQHQMNSYFTISLEPYLNFFITPLASDLTESLPKQYGLKLSSKWKLEY